MLHTELKVVAVGEPDLIFSLSCDTNHRRKAIEIWKLNQLQIKKVTH